MEQKLVTRADCDCIIKKCIGGDKFEVVNYKVKPFDDKEREYYKPECILEVSVKISKNISRFRFFLKKFSTEHPPFNELLQSIRASERELLFYEHFLPMLEKALTNYDSDFTPHFLYGRINRIMVLEDMSLKYFGLAKKSNLQRLDRFHVSLALKGIAKLHSASLAYEEKLKDAEDNRLFEEKDLLAQDSIWTKSDDGLGMKIIHAGIKGLKALMKEVQKVDELDKALSQQIDNLVERTFEIMKFHKTYRNVLGHGNLHAKNMLFKYDKNNIASECVLRNFGFCRYFLPAYDVLSLIFNCTDRLFRQHYFTYLIRYYYDCLDNELTKQDLNVEQFLRFEDYTQSINYLMPAIKLQTVLNLQDFGAKPGFYKAIRRDEKIYRTYIYEDKSLFMLELYKKDPIFKEMISEAIEEVLEILRTPQVSRETCYGILENRLETTVYDLETFSLKQIGDDEESYELSLEVSEGGKDSKINNTFKYVVKCGPDQYFIVKRPQEECVQIK